MREPSSGRGNKRKKMNKNRLPWVTIVIVNYNGENVLNDCISSLKQIDYTNYRVVVVDNNSQDNSINKLRNAYPDVKIIQNKENLGVAEGNNTGVRYALKKKSDFILLLNGDTEVAKNFLTELIKRAQRNKKYLVCSKIYYFDRPKYLWYAGGYINWFSGTSFHTGEGKKDQGQYNQAKKVKYSSTCCLLVPNEVFRRIGLFDKKYFIYFDDVDFCARVIKNGYPIIYEPKSIVWHKVGSFTGGSQSPNAIYYGTRNKLYFMKKNSSFVQFIVFFFVFYLVRLLRIVELAIQGKFSNIGLIFQAIKDYCGNHLGYKKIKL